MSSDATCTDSNTYADVIIDELVTCFLGGEAAAHLDGVHVCAVLDDDVFVDAADEAPELALDLRARHHLKGENPG